MAKVTLSPAFESLSGTLCSRSGDYVALNKQTGKMYLSKRHESNHVATEAQEAVMQTFTSRSQFASAWWNANKPQSTGEKGTEEYQLVMKAYKAQRKIGNPYAYLPLSSLPTFASCLAVMTSQATWYLRAVLVAQAILRVAVLQMALAVQANLRVAVLPMAVTKVKDRTHVTSRTISQSRARHNALPVIFSCCALPCLP